MKEESLVLYQLMINQLIADGYFVPAHLISQATFIQLPTDEQKKNEQIATATWGTGGLCRLFYLVQRGLRAEQDDQAGAKGPTQLNTITSLTSKVGKEQEDHLQSRTGKASSNPNFQTRFLTTHKNEVRVAKFSPDGQYVATGSSDTSIKLLDANKMKLFTNSKGDLESKEELLQANRPVLKTFYDHTQPINDLDFHPSLSLLASGSKDCTIRFWDYKSSTRRGFKFFQDTNSVRTLNFHPGGDFLVVGTEHHMIRIYDCNTGQAYTNSQTSENHYQAINMCRYHPEGKLFASCSKDGGIRIWDAINNKLVFYIPQAHSGAEVSSVQFSASSKYLLSCGKDSTVRLWDLHGAKQIRSFVGATNTKIRLNATFSFEEDYVISSDETSNIGIVWDSHSGDIVQKLTGHTGPIRCTAASPTEQSLMTCSDDHRGRFWVSEKPEKPEKSSKS